MSCKEDMMSTDRGFRKAIFDILAHYADYAEYCHRKLWPAFTKDMSLRRKKSMRWGTLRSWITEQRQQLDKFLWRLQNRIASLVEQQPLSKDLEIQLKLFAEYLQHCPTRIMSCQVFDVSMETLLQVKVRHSRWFSCQRSKTWSTEERSEFKICLISLVSITFLKFWMRLLFIIGTHQYQISSLL